MSTVKPDESPFHRKHERYLSHSRVNRYMACPEQFRLYYVEGLRPKRSPAALEFGTAVHKALAALFTDGEDLVAAFKTEWSHRQDRNIGYGMRNSWEELNRRGQLLMETFVEQELDRVDHVEEVETAFEIRVSNVREPFVGVIDLVAHLDGEKTLIDFKTAGAKYQPFEACLSDQLTAYSLAQPSCNHCGFCVLIKTKEPRIEWHLTERNGAHATSYLRKVELIGRAIANREFYRRPGKWCMQCDYLPVCLGNSRQSEETLCYVE